MYTHGNNFKMLCARVLYYCIIAESILLWYSFKLEICVHPANTSREPNSTWWQQCPNLSYYLPEQREFYGQLSERERRPRDHKATKMVEIWVTPPENFTFSWQKSGLNGFECFRQASGLVEKEQISQIPTLIYTKGDEAKDILSLFTWPRIRRREVLNKVAKSHIRTRTI